MKNNIIGTFRYKEPQIPRIGRDPHHYPTVTLYADPSLQLLFPQFQDYINTKVTLDSKKDHAITIEQQASNTFKFLIDGKVIVVAQIP